MIHYDSLGCLGAKLTNVFVLVPSYKLNDIFNTLVTGKIVAKKTTTTN